MKKVAIICMVCLMAMTARAQYVAFLNLQLGTNVTAEETENISYNIRVNFHPDNFEVMKMGVVNKAIDSLGYDETRMTREQQCTLGRRLEATLMVVGVLNKVMDEYRVELQVIDISTGNTVAGASDNFQKSEYRGASKSIAQRLAYHVECCL